MDGHFDPSAYGQIAAQLLAEERIPALGPGEPNAAAKPLLEALTVERLFAHARVHDADMANLCRGGLWLYHDYLDQSHTISQSVETSTGAFWHGIMHRREPDYGNAAHWFRRVGEHPIFPSLRELAAEHASSIFGLAAEAHWLIDEPTWDPFQFINLCQAVAHRRSAEHGLCRWISLCEWQLLFDYSYRQAVGAS